MKLNQLDKLAEDLRQAKIKFFTAQMKVDYAWQAVDRIKKRTLGLALARGEITGKNSETRTIQIDTALADSEEYKAALNDLNEARCEMNTLEAACELAENKLRNARIYVNVTEDLDAEYDADNNLPF